MLISSDVKIFFVIFFMDFDFVFIFLKFGIKGVNKIFFFIEDKNGRMIF